jgi:hypothetical protein
MWKNYSTKPGAWLDGVTFESIASGPGAVGDLAARFKDEISGIVLYDTAVPSTANVASTVAGVENLLPVPYRPSNETASVYRQLVTQLGLKVVVDLVGKFNGSVTGSAKCDAYMWAKEQYLDTNRSNTALIGYYVDFFGATLAPAYPTPVPVPTPSPPAAGDRIVQGQRLSDGASLMSASGGYSLQMQTDGNLVIYHEGNSIKTNQTVIWATNTAGHPGAYLLLDTTGEVLVQQPKNLNAGTALESENQRVQQQDQVLWRSGVKGKAGVPYWLWMQHDGNLVVYQGICCSGIVVWDSNTVQSLLGASASSMSATGTIVGMGGSSHAVGSLDTLPGSSNAKYASFRAKLDRGGSEKLTSDYALTQSTNHDFIVANKGFFIDLSIWGDETPNDDPLQPLGTDRKTLLVCW